MELLLPLTVLLVMALVISVLCLLLIVSIVLLEIIDKSDPMPVEVVPQDTMETTRLFSALSVLLDVSLALQPLSALPASKSQESTTISTTMSVSLSVQLQPSEIQQDLHAQLVQLLVRLVQVQQLHVWLVL